MRIGVVRHEVKTSAGRSGLVGSDSFTPHAPRRMYSRMPVVGCCAWPGFFLFAF